MVGAAGAVVVTGTTDVVVPTVGVVVVVTGALTVGGGCVVVAGTDVLPIGSVTVGTDGTVTTVLVTGVESVIVPSATRAGTASTFAARKPAAATHTSATASFTHARRL